MTAKAPAKLDQLVSQSGATQQPLPNGAFGFVVAAGRVYGNADAAAGTVLDDVVSTAFQERAIYGPGAGTEQQSGYLYVFAGSTGSPPLSSSGLRLRPAVAEQQQWLGYRSLEIGRLVSTASIPNATHNLVWSGAMLRDFPIAGGGSLPNVGVVYGWQVAGPLAGSTPDLPVLAIFAPNEAGTSAPMPYQNFGHRIVLADIDGDGTNELIVSAHEYNGKKGRVWIFWGDPARPFGLDATPGAQHVVTAIDPPGIDAVFAGLQLLPCHEPFGAFGSWFDADDVNGDGKADLVIAETNYPQRSPGLPPGCNPYGGPTRVGRVHVYGGDQIPRPAPGVFTPLAIAPTPAQTFVPPPDGNVPGNDPEKEESFGFYLWILDFDGDGKLDVAVHSELRDFQGGPGGVPPAQTQTGSLNVYRNLVAPPTTAIQFDSDAQRRPTWWLFSDAPVFEARYGKWLEVGRWKRDVDPAVFENTIGIGEPDTVAGGHQVPHAGKVHLFFQSELFTIPQYTPYALPPHGTIIDSSPLIDFSSIPGAPAPGPEANEYFGRWFAFGNYTTPGVAEKRDLVITASGKPVWVVGQSQGVLGAGAATVVRSAQ